MQILVFMPIDIYDSLTDTVVVGAIYFTTFMTLCMSIFYDRWQSLNCLALAHLKFKNGGKVSLRNNARFVFVSRILIKFGFV